MLKLYRNWISPLLHFWAGPGMGCRFHPTCSAYTEQAIRERGAIRGTWLALLRVGRCHPWSQAGWDPVPARAKQSLKEMRS